MPDTQQSAEQNNNSGTEQGTEGTQAEFKAPQSQEELDRIINKAVGRAHSKYAGFDEIKAKADQLDQLQEASKSELEREREARVKAEKERDGAQLESLRATVAAEKGVPATSLNGTDRASLEASADNLLQWRQDANQHFGGTARSSGFRSGATGTGTDTGADPKERAAAAVRQLGQSGR